jgi:hypothetical protein
MSAKILSTGGRRTWSRGTLLFLQLALAVSVISVTFTSVTIALDFQVTFDTTGHVETLSRAMAERLQVLVDEYPDLAEARLFRDEQDRWSLEVTSRRGGALQRQRRQLTSEEAVQLRQRVTDQLTALGAPDPNSGPRTLLVTSYTVAGVAFYDWAMPMMLNVQDGRAAVGLGLVTAGASFYVPYATTSHRPVTYGEAEMVRNGLLRGAIYGELLNGLIQPDHDNGRASAASVMGGSLAGGIGGSHWARCTKMSAGTARMVTNGSDFGMLASGALLVMAEPDDDRAIFGTLFAGGMGGATAGYLRAKDRPYSWGDAEALRAAGFLGAYSGMVIANWSDTDESKAYVAASLAGCVAGIVVGDRLVRHTDLSPGQSILIDVGTVAGGVAGLGLAYLTGSDSDDETYYLTSSALGATAGYALTYRSMRRGGGSTDSSTLDLNVNPIAVAGLIGNHDGALREMPASPMLSVSWLF